MKRLLAAAVLFAACAAPPAAGATDPAPIPAAPNATPLSIAAPAPAPAGPRPCCHLLAGSLVAIRLTNEVSSYKAKQGDSFALTLAEPIMVDGRVVVPAGAVGGGEVVDAEAAGLGGKPGKLVLAARYVDYGGVHVPLRAFRLGGGGRNNSDIVIAAEVAVGVFSALIPGGDMVYPAGTEAVAKVATDVSAPPLTDVAPPSSNLPPQRPAP